MKKIFRKWMKTINNYESSSEEPKYSTSTNLKVTSDSKNEIFSQNNEVIPSKQMKLHFAVLSEDENEVEKNIKYVNNVDSLQRTPLHLAVVQGNINIVKILLENNADITVIDNEGFTPFLKAVAIGNLDLVKVFLNENIDREQTDFQGNTALHLAVLYGFYNIISLLLKNHFPIDVFNKCGEYPLHIATQNESTQVVKLLLEHGANVNIGDQDRKTPLFIAVEIGNVSLAELFLNNNADPELRNATGQSIREYVSTQNNINLKTLFSKLKLINGENENSIMNDEDSQNSEQSCPLPPALKPPLSWDVLQMSHNSNDNNAIPTSSNQFVENFTKKETRLKNSGSNNYERNAKSLSFDVSYDFSKNLKSHNRSYSLTSYEVLNLNAFKIKNENLDHVSSHEKLKNQIEDCQKALQELSLDVIGSETNKQHQDLEFNSDYIFGDQNRLLFSDQGSNFSSQTENFKFNSNKNCFSTNPPELVKDDDVNYSKKIDKFNDESSDEDPPFWKNTIDGGYFTVDWKKNDTLRTFKSSSESEDSDSEKDEELIKPSNAIVLKRLKQVSQENEDLETETAVLREATEKLKYDLANYRQISTIKETNLNEITAQLTQMDTKYSKAIEKVNIFQLCMNNLEQEVAHLKQICNKSYKINQQLATQIKQIQEENNRIRSEKDKIVGQNATDVQKLQTDVLYWKTKYEEIVQKKEENNLAGFEMQGLFKLNMELNKMSEKIKDCLCKSDLAKLQDHQQIVLGTTVQQILNETNVKLQNSLTEIKEEVKQKVIEMDRNSASKTEAELQIMDLENTKQKLLLEVAKFTSLMKEKEIEEHQLKEQLEKFNKEKQRVKDEKRKLLIKQSYEDKSSSRKGMYLSAVRNYLNKSKLNSPTNSNSDHLLNRLKLELDSEVTKENE